MQQFQVIETITLILGRMVEAHLQEALGKRIPVTYEVGPESRKGDGSVSILHFGLDKVANADREYERAGGGEQFRNPPLVLRSHYLMSAWAKAPADQTLLGLVLRTFLDNPYLEATPEEEATIGYSEVPWIDLRTMDFEEHRRMCEALQIPLAPSVAYAVGFRLRSGKVTPIRRVKERVIDYRKIDG